MQSKCAIFELIRKTDHNAVELFNKFKFLIVAAKQELLIDKIFHYLQHHLT